MDINEFTDLLIMHIENGDHPCEAVSLDSFIVTMPDGEKFRVTVEEED